MSFDNSDSSLDVNSPIPGLDPRHNAMLSEMGVHVWWSQVGRDTGQQAVAVQSAPVAKAPDTLAQVPPSIRPPLPVKVVAMAPVSAPADMAAISVRAPAAGISAGDIPALDAAIRVCGACDLGRLRQQAVPGMGDTSPDWLIVGEAPGEEEDRLGLPFVGRAGKLLDRMLLAMGMSRQHKVYITNVIKCRPPHNRNPDPVEIAQCMPFLWRQIELLRPRMVLAMGRFAAHTLLSQGAASRPEALSQMPLGKLRGRVHQLEVGGHSVPLVVTYHPAFLLRSPSEKSKAWADLCLALDTFQQLPAAD